MRLGGVGHRASEDANEGKPFLKISLSYSGEPGKMDFHRNSRPSDHRTGSGALKATVDSWNETCFTSLSGCPCFAHSGSLFMHTVRSLRVLVVDDNQDSADSLTSIMSILGHDVRTAYDGDVEDLVLTFRPDAFLLDVGLPKRDGIALASLIRRLEGFKDSLIITITGYHDPQTKKRAQDAGVNHYFTKPADPMEVVELLEARRRRLEERVD